VGASLYDHGTSPLDVTVLFQDALHDANRLAPRTRKGKGRRFRVLGRASPRVLDLGAMNRRVVQRQGPHG
jgi:hypothetical protein